MVKKGMQWLRGKNVLQNHYKTARKCSVGLCTINEVQKYVSLDYTKESEANFNLYKTYTNDNIPNTNNLMVPSEGFLKIIRHAQRTFLCIQEWQWSTLSCLPCEILPAQTFQEQADKDTYMMVLMPESCWNICKPHPTTKARRVGA